MDSVGVKTIKTAGQGKVTRQQNGRDEAELRIVSAKIDSCVAIVTETWLDNNIPDAAVELAGRSLLREKRETHSLQMNNNPEAAVIVAGDFNHVELKAVFPKFQTPPNFPMRDNNTLDQVYCNIPGAYKAVAAAHLGMSDHICESDPCQQTSDLQDKTNHQNCTGLD
ncbi:hypothetical protein L3Q82_002897 [Scortum barcoo]|uniref:Uncharacterized protein n=1 Tax=Scortum barcoo TaxID=214431 RepID=A0ACB8VW23_9TELE|nr:hypothetical protein L3Q82_002897 [Scortum barcoo]